MYWGLNDPNRSRTTIEKISHLIVNFLAAYIGVRQANRRHRLRFSSKIYLTRYPDRNIGAGAASVPGRHLIKRAIHHPLGFLEKWK